MVHAVTCWYTQSTGCFTWVHTKYMQFRETAHRKHTTTHKNTQKTHNYTQKHTPTRIDTKKTQKSHTKNKQIRYVPDYPYIYECVWYYTERQVTTGGSLAFTARVCELMQNITWINMNYLELIRMNVSKDELFRFIRICMILCGAMCCHGGQSCFYSVCV